MASQISDFILRGLSYTVVPVPAILENSLAKASSLFGISADSFMFFILTILAYPLGFTIRFIPSVFVKHMLSIVFGLIFTQYLSKELYIIPFLYVIICYIIILSVPRKRCGPIVLILSMTFLFFFHVYDYIYYYGIYTTGIETVIMMLVIRLSSLAFNYQDGGDDLDESKSIYNKRRKEYSLKEFPPLYIYLSYSYYYATLLSGPVCEFKVYNENIENKDNYVPIEVSLAFKCFFRSLIFVAGYIIGSTLFKTNRLVDPDFYHNSSYPVYLMYFLVSLMLCRCRYYLIWSVVEGASIIGGFGYVKDSPDGHNWYLVDNVDFWKFEYLFSIREGTKIWNKGTQNWLDKYIYERVNNNMFFVYIVSAVWHGVYPGYYVCFFTVGFLQYIEKLQYKKLLPYIQSSKTYENYYYYYMHILNFTTHSFHQIPFVFYDVASTIFIWKKLRFYLHIMYAIASVAVFLLPTIKLKKV